MPSTSQGFKRIRQNLRHRKRNRMLRSSLRSSILRMRDVIEAGGEATKISEQFRQLASVVDSAVRKGIIHSNSAARIKSRLHKAIKRASS